MGKEMKASLALMKRRKRRRKWWRERTEPPETGNWLRRNLGMCHRNYMNIARKLFDLRKINTGNGSASLGVISENCLAFNRFNEWVVATGSTDKTVKLFDLRKINTALHTFDCHKIDEEQTPEDAEDGPPELLFIHGGVKYLTSLGTHVKTGLWQVWLRTTYSRYGRWLRTYTMMKMICPKNQPNLLLSVISLFDNLTVFLDSLTFLYLFLPLLHFSPLDVN